MHITVLGLGNMGSALADRLLTGGHDLTVWNRSPDKARPLVDRGARLAPTATDAAEGADAVLISVRDDDAVLELLRRLADAGVHVPIVNCSTSAPARTAEMIAVVPTFVAAPILGTPAAVAAGRAAYYVAGPSDAVAALHDLWTALSDSIVLFGNAPEQATTAKLISNHLLLTGLAVLAEGVAVGQAAGIDDEALAALLAEHPLVAPGLRNRVRDMIDGDHTGWFPMPLGAKDLALFTAVGDAHALPLPLAGLAHRQYASAEGLGLGDADVAGVVELLRRHDR